MPDSTCWTVIKGAAAGRAESRETFARTYASVIGAYFAARWKLPASHEEVRDALQEVLLDCFKTRGALERVDPDRPGGFRAFLYGIARTAAHNIERRRARRLDRQAEAGFNPDDLPADEATLSQVFDRAWARMLARTAVGLMIKRANDEGRETRIRGEVMRLRYSDDLPPREIARRLQVERREVYRVLATAKNEFRNALLDVMAHNNPHASPRDLEKKCVGMLALID